MWLLWFLIVSFNLWSQMYFGLVLFVGCIVLNTQEIIEKAHTANGDMDYVVDSLILFFGFVRVFLQLLSIMVSSLSYSSLLILIMMLLLTSLMGLLLCSWRTLPIKKRRRNNGETEAKSGKENKTRLKSRCLFLGFLLVNVKTHLWWQHMFFSLQYRFDKQFIAGPVFENVTMWIYNWRIRIWSPMQKYTVLWLWCCKWLKWFFCTWFCSFPILKLSWSYP